MSMTVAWVNPAEPVKRQKHKCNVCGLYFGWREESLCYEKFVGKGYSGYEKKFLICSEVCHEKAKQEGLIENFNKCGK